MSTPINQNWNVDDLIQKLPPIEFEVVESLEVLCATKLPSDGKVYLVYYNTNSVDGSETSSNKLVTGYQSKWIDLETGWFIQPSDLSGVCTIPKCSE